MNTKINCPFDDYAKGHLKAWAERDHRNNSTEVIAACTRFCVEHPATLDKHDWPTVLELATRKL